MIIVSMERDWVPTVASDGPDTATRVSYDLTHLNTVMRRIDILCKLGAPLAIAPVISALTPAYSVFAIASLGLVSWGVERWCAHQVWTRQPRLRAPKGRPSVDQMSVQLEHFSITGDDDMSIDLHSDQRHVGQTGSWPQKTMANIFALLKQSLQSNLDNLSYFFSSPLWIPALGVAMLHASVLNYGNTVITWLLNAGFSVNLVTVAKASGSIFEMGSTVVFPFAIRLLISHKASDYVPISNVRTTSSRHDRPALPGNEDEDGFEGGMESVKEEATKASINGTDVAVAQVALWGFYGHVAILVSLVPRRSYAYLSNLSMELILCSFNSPPFLLPSSLSLNP